MSRAEGGADGELLVEAPSDSKAQLVDRYDRVPFGSRWFTDAFELIPLPSGFGLLLTDMTQVKKALRILRDAKIPATYQHLVLRAVALALVRSPNAFKLICNYKKLSPAQLDIGLSMAGQTTYSPVVVIPAVDQKPLSLLVPSIIKEVDAAMQRETRDLATLAKLVVPFRWLRLLVLRVLHRSMKWRKRISGHFQVTCLNNLDVDTPFLFYSNAVVAYGELCDRVVAIDGEPAVRPTIWLTGVSDGTGAYSSTGGNFLHTVKEVLEGEELVREAREAAALKAAKKAGG
jgi:hypothetical protein